MDEDDYKCLEVEELCSHKSWKARLYGFSKLVQEFDEIEEEKSVEWIKYLGSLKTFVIDNNVACQEKALEAVLLFVEKSSFAGKVVNEVVSGVVQKCLAAPKPRTRELATKIVLMFVEVEKQTPTVDGVLEGVHSKNPKIRAACVQVLAETVSQFGPKVVNVSKVVKKVAHLIEDKDQSVRSETRGLLVGFYHWLGEPFRAILAPIIKPNQLTEIETEYCKIKANPPFPRRSLRSEQTNQVSKFESPVRHEVAHKVVEDSVEFDTYDKLEPVDVLSKLNENFYSQIESKKWLERKEALDSLDRILSVSPKIDASDYSDLVRGLKKIILKDSNVLVVICAIKCITGISRGLRKNFKQYSGVILPALFEKFKEKKQNVVQALREAVDVVYQCTNLEAVLEEILVSLEDKNPSVKAEMTAFLTRSLKKNIQQNILNKKNLKPLCQKLMKLLRDQDRCVRDNTAECLGEVMKIVGEKVIRQFLGNVDDVCIKKITEYFEKTEKSQEPDEKVSCSQEVNQPKNGSPSRLSLTKKPNDVNEDVTGAKGNVYLPPSQEKDKQILKKTKKKDHSQEESNISKTAQNRIEVIFTLTQSQLSDLANKNWEVRLDAVTKLRDQVNSMESFSANLGEAEGLLVERILDKNYRISEISIAVVESIGRAMGSSWKRYLPVFLPPLVKAIGDQKACVKSAATSCLDTWAGVCGIDKFFEGTMFTEALKSGTPAAQGELWDWLAEKILKFNLCHDEVLHSLLVPLFSHLNGRHGVLRRRASEALVAIMTNIGYEKTVLALENIVGSRASYKSIKGILDKARYNMPLQFSGTEETKTLDYSEKSPDISKTRVGSSKKFKTHLKSLKNSGGSGMLQENNFKVQRFIDQGRVKSSGKISKGELMEQLNIHMIAAKIDQDLVSDLFHSDFRLNLRAIECLTEDFKSNREGLKCNLDIILRWVVLKCQETNPSITTKILEYLITIFKGLKEDKYNLLDFEAASILPYLIAKTSDSKDSVRSNVRTIMKLITSIYPPSKQFPYVFNGTNSKIARQKLECIEHLNFLIEEFGVKICGIKLIPILKRLTKLVEERDHAVRNAALKCLFQLAVFEGDKVMKDIGQLSQKSMLLLEEKFSAAANCVTKNLNEVDCSEEMSGSLEKVNENSFSNSKISRESETISSSDSQEAGFLIDHKPLTFRSPNVIGVDLKFLSESSPPVNPTETEESQNIFTLSEAGENLIQKVTEDIEHILKSIGRMDSINSIDECCSLKPLIINFISNLVELLGELKGKNHPVVLGYYTTIFSLLKKIVNHKGLCAQISEEKLLKLFEELLILINEGKRLCDYRYREVNKLLFALLENTDKSLTIATLVNMLSDTRVKSYNELVSRCLWKLVNSRTEEELDYGKVLAAIDAFMAGREGLNYPDDAALKTVKSLLYTIMKTGREEVLELTRAQPPASLELVAAVRRISRKLMASDKEKVVRGRELPLQASSDLLCGRKKGLTPETAELWRRLDSIKEKAGFMDEEVELEIQKKLEEIRTGTVNSFSKNHQTLDVDVITT